MLAEFPPRLDLADQTSESLFPGQLVRAPSTLIWFLCCICASRSPDPFSYPSLTPASFDSRNPAHCLSVWLHSSSLTLRRGTRCKTAMATHLSVKRKSQLSPTEEDESLAASSSPPHAPDDPSMSKKARPGAASDELAVLKTLDAAGAPSQSDASSSADADLSPSERVQAHVRHCLQRLNVWAESEGVDPSALHGLDPAPTEDAVVRVLRYHPMINAKYGFNNAHMGQVDIYLETYLERARITYKLRSKLRRLRSNDDRQLAVKALDGNLLLLSVTPLEEDDSSDEPPVVELKVSEKMDLSDACVSVQITSHGDLICLSGDSKCTTQHEKHRPCKHILFVLLGPFDGDVVDAVRSRSVDGAQLRQLLQSDWLMTHREAMLRLDACPICMQDFVLSPKRVGCNLDPSHAFHESCIRIWRRIAPTCPLCRSHSGFSRQGSTNIALEAPAIHAPFQRAYSLVAGGELEARKVHQLVRAKQKSFVAEQLLAGVHVCDLFAAVQHRSNISNNSGSRFVVVVCIDSGASQQPASSLFHPYPIVSVGWQRSTAYAFLRDRQHQLLQAADEGSLLDLSRRLWSVVKSNHTPSAAAAASSSAAASSCAVPKATPFWLESPSLQGLCPGFRVQNNAQTSQPALIFFVAYKSLLPVFDWFYDTSDFGRARLFQYLERTSPGFGAQSGRDQLQMDVQQRFWFRQTCHSLPPTGTPKYEVQHAIAGLGSAIGSLQHKCTQHQACPHAFARQEMLKSDSGASFLPEFQIAADRMDDDDAPFRQIHRKQRGKRRAVISDSESESESDAFEDSPLKEDIPIASPASSSSAAAAAPASAADSDSAPSTPLKPKSMRLDFGTLGGIVCCSVPGAQHSDACGQLYALTCRHVMLSHVVGHQDVVHQQMLHPPMFLEDLPLPAEELIAKLTVCSLSTPASPPILMPPDIDAILVPVRAASVCSQFRFERDRKNMHSAPLPANQLPPSGVVLEQLVAGTEVFKVGAFSSWTRGTLCLALRQEEFTGIIRAIDSDAPFQLYDGQLEGEQPFLSAFPVEAHAGSGARACFSDPGDSGSLIFTVNNRDAVGIIFAGNYQYSWAHPLYRILNSVPPTTHVADQEPLVWRLHA